MEVRVREPCVSRMHRSATREGSQGKALKLARVCGQRGGGAGAGNSSQGRVSGEVGGLAALSSPSKPLLLQPTQSTLCNLSLTKAAIC